MVSHLQEAAGFNAPPPIVLQNNKTDNPVSDAAPNPDVMSNDRASENYSIAFAS